MFTGSCSLQSSRVGIHSICPSLFETAYRFWVDLCDDGDVAEQLAELGLWWHNDRLEVAREHIGKADLIRDIVGLFTSVLKFKRFSDSRWVSQGPSCRTFVIGRQLGLDELVNTIRKDPKASDYYIHGYENYTG